MPYSWKLWLQIRVNLSNSEHGGLLYVQMSLKYNLFLLVLQVQASDNGKDTEEDRKTSSESKTVSSLHHLESNFLWIGKGILNGSNVWNEKKCNH